MPRMGKRSRRGHQPQLPAAEKKPPPSPPASLAPERSLLDAIANGELDILIDEITTDCHDDDEQLVGFENAFDEDASFPLLGSAIGEDVEVLSVSTVNNRRELIATCTRAGHRYEIALLDVTNHADQTTSRLLAAYRRWLT